MAYLDDFREAAIPRLREAAKVQAFLIACDMATPDEGRSEVIDAARKLGSAWLHPRDQERLVGWIGETIWAELTKAQDRVAAIKSKGDAAERDDPIRYWAGLAARCSDPERMRWVFASISKPYRKHLIAECRRAEQA